MLLSKRSIVLLVLASIGLSAIVATLAHRIARMVEQSEPNPESADTAAIRMPRSSTGAPTELVRT